ncbi:hypothetical protein C8J55DRAFT_602692 [Lentinula edodes]|uniref:Uncharacterized protein n=1 Tax=Lentinula lateritia TaxID=40482 RepID=A0A9W9AXE5_9AGAR|nr:hypothetical protein C8J55DRAFT_602692 [Lentinula edodes]
MSFLHPHPGMDDCSPSLDQSASFSTNSKSITHRGEHKCDSISLLEAPSCEGLKENVPSSTNTDLYFSDCSGEVSALNNFFDPISLFGGFNTMGEMDISPPPMPDFLASPQAASSTSASTVEIERGVSPSTSSESHHTTPDNLWDSAPAVTGGSDVELATSQEDNSVTSSDHTPSTPNYSELFGGYDSSLPAVDLSLPRPLLHSSITAHSGCGFVLDPLLIDHHAAPPVHSGVQGPYLGPESSPHIDIPSALTFVNTNVGVSPAFVGLGVNQVGNESPTGQTSSFGNESFFENPTTPSRAPVELSYFAHQEVAPLATRNSPLTGAASFNPDGTQTGYTPVVQSTHYQSMLGPCLNPNGAEMGPSTVAQLNLQPPPASHHPYIFGFPKAEPTLNYHSIPPHPHWNKIAFQFGVAPPPPATIIRSRSRELVVQAGLKWDHDKGPLILPDLGYLPQPDVFPPVIKTVMDTYFNHIIRPPPTADHYILWWNAVWISKQFVLKVQQQQQATSVGTAISSERRSFRGNPPSGTTRRKTPTSQNHPDPQSTSPVHNSSIQLPTASQPSAGDLAKMKPFSIFITETGRPRGRAATISDERSKKLKKARPAPY